MLLLAAACAHAPAPAPVTRAIAPARESERPSEPGFLGEGLASFYGPGLVGNLTASGERFDPNALTAAHRKLPFGTCVRVVNLHNGRSVEVRINDRGPFAGHRLIDVSTEAARRLGMVESGVARVRLFACGRSR